MNDNYDDDEATHVSQYFADAAAAATSAASADDDSTSVSAQL